MTTIFLKTIFEGLISVGPLFVVTYFNRFRRAGGGSRTFLPGALTILSAVVVSRASGFSSCATDVRSHPEERPPSPQNNPPPTPVLYNSVNFARVVKDFDNSSKVARQRLDGWGEGRLLLLILNHCVEEIKTRNSLLSLPTIGKIRNAVNGLLLRFSRDVFGGRVTTSDLEMFARHRYGPQKGSTPARSLTRDSAGTSRISQRSGVHRVIVDRLKTCKPSTIDRCINVSKKENKTHSRIPKMYVCLCRRNPRLRWCFS